MRLAVVPGDGIGPEVIGEALKVLDEVAPSVETTQYDLGAARWHSTRSVDQLVRSRIGTAAR